MESHGPLIAPRYGITYNALVPLRRAGAFPFSGLLLCLGLLLAGGVARADRDIAGARPDLLLVTLDTTRADALGCYGSAAARTVTLDALAAAGTRYASAWSPVPLTLPAHASLFTGLEPAKHGLRDNGWGRLGSGMPVLAEELRRAGYATGGVIASRVLDARFGLDRGFDFYDERIAAERLGQYGDAERDAAAVVDAALGWLAARRAAAETPIFLWVHFYDPHAPYAPPADLGGPSEAQRYAGEIAHVDRELGRLLQGWPSGRRRLVAVVGDHGEAFGEHGEHGHGLLLYRPTLEVPLLVSGEGVRPGTVIPAPVATRRLAATLLHLLGISSGLPGPPLPLTASGDDRSPIFHETLFPASAYGWSPIAAATSSAGRVIAAPRPEVFDLAADPAEARNRIADPTPALRGLQRSLVEHLAAHSLEVEAPVLDAETASSLRALGYLSGQSRRAGERDPKDGVALLVDFEKAQELLEAGRGSEALQMLEALVARSPESVPFLARLAAVQRQAGRNDAALATLDRALKLSPQLDLLHQSRAEVLLDLGRRAEAAEAFRLVLKLAPRSAVAWLKLAELELRAGRPAEEERLLNDAVAAGTASAAVLARLGEIALRRGDFAAADRHLGEATSLLPEWPAPWKLWAEVARRQGRADLASERERRARER